MSLAADIDAAWPRQRTRPSGGGHVSTNQLCNWCIEMGSWLIVLRTITSRLPRDHHQLFGDEPIEDEDQTKSHTASAASRGPHASGGPKVLATTPPTASTSNVTQTPPKLQRGKEGSALFGFTQFRRRVGPGRGGTGPSTGSCTPPPTRRPPGQTLSQLVDKPRLSR